MKRLQSIWRRGRIAASTVMCWLVVYGAAFAQQPKPGKKEEQGGGAYVASYMLVLLGVGLGMLIVCRSSTRRTRAKPEQYEDSKTLL